VALAALPLTIASAGAQEAGDLTITVKKVVVGTGAPSVVHVLCTGNDVDDGASAFAEGTASDLGFDASGNPTIASGVSGFEIEDGAWVLSGVSGDGGNCVYTETATGGAASTAYTCDYTFTPVDVPEAEQILQAGCLSAAGAGIGPVQVNYPGELDVQEQASMVVFTNTFTTTPLQPIQPAAAVVVTPAFTG
jgi:hypothetical protein